MLYQPTIGLEIHAELNTQTKMFCDCKNDPDETRPNVNVCPICLGHPGTLPVINKKAVQSVLKIGMATGGHTAGVTEFDRKNYFYPDIPKGYQISQYKNPLVSFGELAGVQITRVHLEEDTGTSSHDRGDYSLVNFNRAGVPLMELVTEPVIHSAGEASNFARELQLLLRYLDVAGANMEKGEMRIEANVSVSSNNTLGTKVEVKNLNSFKIAEKAIEYEIKRQSKILEKGEVIEQETRGWDEKKQITYSQRQKEDSHDYRYFPDPDLPKLDITKLDFELDLVETPEQKRKRFRENFGIKESDIEFYINNFEPAIFAEQIFKKGGKEFNQLASNYIVSDLSGRREEYKKINPHHFVKLIEMIIENKISSRGAKEIISTLGDGVDPEKVAEEMGLLQQSNEEELEKLVEELLEANPEIVGQYKAGKATALQFLIGQGMKLSKGSANPQILKTLLEKKLQ